MMKEVVHTYSLAKRYGDIFLGNEAKAWPCFRPFGVSTPADSE